MRGNSQGHRTSLGGRQAHEALARSRYRSSVRPQPPIRGVKHVGQVLWHAYDDEGRRPAAWKLHERYWDAFARQVVLCGFDESCLQLSFALFVRRSFTHGLRPGCLERVALNMPVSCGESPVVRGSLGARSLAGARSVPSLFREGVASRVVPHPVSPFNGSPNVGSNSI